MLINGQWQNSSNEARFEVLNPATGAVIGHAADASDADIETAVSAAHKAFATWSQTTAEHRSQLLYKAWQLMVSRAEELAQLMTKEQGKPLRASRAEVGYAADFIKFYAEEATRVAGEWLPSKRSDQRFLVTRVPVGVIGMVTPWNYPISMLTRKMAPALAAGCTLVLKPAEATPLCAKAVFEIFAEAGIGVDNHAGVINMVTVASPTRVGEVFTSDPRVAKLAFTGSTAVGRLLSGKAAGNLKRVSVELGGHAPFVVFPDADPVRAAKGACALKFLNSGQACISPNRLFVHTSGHDAFIDTLKERISKLKTGNGTIDGVKVGPLVNQAAIDKATNQVQDAVSKGAKLLVGGAQLTDGELTNGHFFAPTLLDKVTPDMLIYREETFGPIAAVIEYDDVGEVLDMANDTNYGLAAYVYTNELSTALRAMEKLRFGIIGINDVNPTAASAPFGGMGDSGIGREGSHEGISEYLETKLAGFSI